MSVLQFIADLIGSLAWPGVLIGFLLLFRKQVRALLSDRLKRAKIGNIEAEWFEASQQTSEAVQRRGGSVAEIAVGASGGGAAEMNPALKVIQRYQELIAQLRHAVEQEDIELARLPDRELIHAAAGAEIVGLTTRDAFHGLRVMRNLAVHKPEEVAPKMAADFLLLANAAEESLERDLGGDAGVGASTGR